MLIELIAVLFTLISVYYSVKNNIHTWWTGIIGIIFYAILFAQANLPANFILQMIFFYQSVVGWHNWSESEVKPAMSMQTLNKWDNKFYMIVTFALFVILYFMSEYVFHGQMRILDCLTASLCIIANHLLMIRKLQNWLYWIVANGMYIVMFLSAGLMWSAGLYVILLFLAMKGYFKWQTELKK